MVPNLLRDRLVKPLSCFRATPSPFIDATSRKLLLATIAEAPRLNTLPMRWAPAENCVPVFADPELVAAEKLSTPRWPICATPPAPAMTVDRKSTRLNSQSLRHLVCRLLLEKKKK